MIVHGTPNPRVVDVRAFTLIELLIVVGIIAILAAIAIPNFLEAQTRSKVSRVKSDLRSLATAIESYHVDNNVYPVPADQNLRTQGFPGAQPFDTRLPTLLTSPVSYITSLPKDTFSKIAANDTETDYFHYSNRDYIQIYDVVNGDTTETQFNGCVQALTGADPSVVKYTMSSHGPDLDHDLPGSGAEALYDPTNGSVSSGDIYYFGPGRGFKN